MIDVQLRRAGFGVVHDARIPERLITELTHWGAPYRGVYGPIVARCGVTLKAQLVVMTAGTVTDCRACRAVAAAENRPDA